MQTITPIMLPPAGERLVRFAGDRLRFQLADREGRAAPAGWQARLRTNLGRAELRNQEIVHAHTAQLPFAGASWHDLPMRVDGAGWTLELPLTEVGYFRAKAYFIDEQGWQHWPEGSDVGISVHPNQYRTANTIYCAFPRMFGASRTARDTTNPELAGPIQQLDALGYTVIPPSGRFRDLIAQLPHIIDTLGCRILHLLPVNPVPTTYARFGRFGSPYASLDLTAIDPALVEFDRRTTGVDQFCELAYATHNRGARLFLDIVINHTGWGSTLEENHPEWFLRAADGSFVSPGAWGTVWEDLVELHHDRVALWEVVAEALLTWCRRGVDGFRCDAGYKVPLPVWQYVTARVRQEFPDTLFLLEGLGGAWDLTENLLTEGGMQWAYSELFQNFSPAQVAGYLDHSRQASRRVGLLVHYSETHDNDRLARQGRSWSLLRNRLCALASDNGGFGFTCGVEWLAPERVNVHSSRGLAWDNPANLVAELAQLNRLLADHPCFFDGARTTRLSGPESPVLALHRESETGEDAVLVLVNTDLERIQLLGLPTDPGGTKEWRCDLLGQALPEIRSLPEGGWEVRLEPAAACCLAANRQPRGLSGAPYRQARERAAWAMRALGQCLPMAIIPATPWTELARWVDQSAEEFLAAVSALAARQPGASPASPADWRRDTAGETGYSPVILWEPSERRRILPVPPQHWLLLTDTVPFRASLQSAAGGRAQHVESIAAGGRQIACFPPGESLGAARLVVARHGAPGPEITSELVFLAPGPQTAYPLCRHRASPSGEADPVNPGGPGWQNQLVLLTNGIGGMARLAVDLGAITSKYDCVLGANLDPRVPVDRHIFAKRLRVWVNGDGFINALDGNNLASFAPGPPAVWHFLANAGDGRSVEITLTADMVPGSNTTRLHFARTRTRLTKHRPLPEHSEVRLTVRVDIEDRNFHCETRRTPGAEYHFAAHTHALDTDPGFAFTPAPDRQLRVFATDGKYHPQAEWCENIPHPVEQSRGQTGSGDAFSPGWFELPLIPGSGVTVMVTAENETADVPSSVPPAMTPPGMEPARPAGILEEDAFGRQLLRATDAYVVRRDEGVTVIAGYPWFLDWGRDSLICARGLLAAGRSGEVEQLLVTFGRFVQEGTLPNTIHGNDASNRDTSDAPLWYGIVCEELAVEAPGLYQTELGAGAETIRDVLANIAVNYIHGTPNGIRMDVASGLIWSPGHFTWMDTNHPAGTPREGYPVEIQVLWIRLLRQLARLQPPAERARWTELADLASASLLRYFWLEEPGWLADVLLAPRGHPAATATVDSALRSNGLFAVSLGLLTGVRARRCVAAAARHLVVPGALRSLAPLPVQTPLPIYGGGGQLLNNPAEPYWGRYEGDEDTRRKPAYHNGTAWVWTYPSFCEALVRAWEGAPAAVAAARAYLGATDRRLWEGCVGQLPEILDGDAPHQQRGCDAQAWSVTETLRVWTWLNQTGGNAPS